MEDFQKKLEAFRQIVIANCDTENFEYREWFVIDHLAIVEKIAMELCEIYNDADKDVVSALVWFHDFGKPLDEKNEREITEKQGVATMRQIGFAPEFIEKVFTYWTRMELKNDIDLSKEAIETQIVSTADGASHFVGKFYPSYFRDDVTMSVPAIGKKIREKIKQDWERKIVLPEVKKAFKERYRQALEITGEYPDTFIL